MKSPACPRCNSANTCPIFYGYPVDIEAYLESEAKGELIGGGCTIREGSPTWHCHDCTNKWGKTK